MVAVAVEPNKIAVRGFNNQSTFGLPENMRSKYDDVDRKLNSRENVPAWSNANEAVYGIDYDLYLKGLWAILALGGAAAFTSLRL